MFYDAPELIHDCMRTWLATGRRRHRPASGARHARRDLLRRGHLLQPRPADLARAMMKEFLLPYYQQVIANIKRARSTRRATCISRSTRTATPRPVIPIYREHRHGRHEPLRGRLRLRRGGDRPAVSRTGHARRRWTSACWPGAKQAIDRLVERIFPAMRRAAATFPRATTACRRRCRYRGLPALSQALFGVRHVNAAARPTFCLTAAARPYNLMSENGLSEATANPGS